MIRFTRCFFLVNPVLTCVIFENQIQNQLRFSVNNELQCKITVMWDGAYFDLIFFALCGELIILFFSPYFTELNFSQK